MKAYLDVQQGGCLRGNCAATVDFTNGQLAYREFWSDIWLYSKAIR